MSVCDCDSFIATKSTVFDFDEHIEFGLGSEIIYFIIIFTAKVTVPPVPCSSKAQTNITCVSKNNCDVAIKQISNMRGLNWHNSLIYNRHKRQLRKQIYNCHVTVTQMSCNFVELHVLRIGTSCHLYSFLTLWYSQPLCFM